MKKEEGKGREKRRREADDGTHYLLYLYVAGNTLRSLQSIKRLREFCDKHLNGKYELKVVDICQQPGLASESQILAAPTLIKRYPLPLQRLVGDFSDQPRVSVALGFPGQ